ncbi:MAG: type II toxin-antitoxin system RelE/ParE family toxin [Myxococcota bacterium]
MRLNISSEATTDLGDIWDAVSEFDVDAADRLLRTLGAAMERLTEYPLLGRVRPELGPGLRSWVVGRYLVFYESREDEFRIFRIPHGRRDIDTIF